MQIVITIETEESLIETWPDVTKAIENSTHSLKMELTVGTRGYIRDGNGERCGHWTIDQYTE